MIAKSVDDLHSPNNNLNKDTALDERGKMVNGRTEKPNTHDILTGSRVDGTAFGPQFFSTMMLVSSMSSFGSSTRAL